MASSALALPFAQLVDVQPDGAGFSAFIHGAWSNYGGVPLGGLFSALAIKAISMFHARDGQPNMRPSSLSMHFLDSPKLGETVKIEVVAERTGRTFSFTRFTIRGPKKTYISGQAAFTSLPSPTTRAGVAQSILPPASVPDRVHKAEARGGPAKFLELFESRAGEEYEDRWRTHPPSEKDTVEVPLGAELFIQPHDGTPADWALLALYADLPIATQSMLDDSAKMRAQGRAKIYSTTSLSITFNHLPSSQWIRQRRALTARVGELEDWEFAMWGTEGGVPCAVGRQVGWMREVALPGPAEPRMGKMPPML